MPPPDDTAARVPLGPVGRYVIENLKQLREARRLSYRELADKLKELGRPIPTLGLSRIEKGTRRVDADDLVALALALGVNPSALLLPRTVQQRDEISLTNDERQAANDTWAWADGTRPLPAAGPFTRSSADWFALADFGEHARPSWAPPQQMELLARAAQQPNQEDSLQPIATAIVTSPLGVLVGRRNDGKPPWTFIAGEVEPGEQPDFAAVREVKEETGLEVRTVRVLGERVHPKTGRDMIYIACAPTIGTDVFVGDPIELAEVRWIGLAEADELLPGMFEPVREYLSQELAGGEG